jgi:transcription initiation protein SPT3
MLLVPRLFITRGWHSSEKLPESSAEKDHLTMEGSLSAILDSKAPASIQPTAKSFSKHRYQQEIQAMMFTFGDTRNPLPSVTQLVEDIVHNQMIDLIQRATKIAARRGSRYLSIDDFIFLVRHDSFKVKRLKEFLSWKDIRKNVRNNSGENNDEIMLGAGGAAVVAVGDEDEKLSNSQTASPNSKAAAAGVVKKRKIFLSWDYLDAFGEEGESASSESEDSSDLEDLNNEAIHRLREADIITREMSKEEYMEYSECRQASFTFKKAKKFREWLSLSKFVEVRPNDDVIEILGFLAWEIVRIITETAVVVKETLEKKQLSPSSSIKEAPLSVQDLFSKNIEWKQNHSELLQKFIQSCASASVEKEKSASGSPIKASSSSQQQHQQQQPSRTIFERPANRTPLQVEYIYEACRRLERYFYCIPNFFGGRISRVFAPIC